MGSSSIPAAIDYLVAAIDALPACALPVVVSDGWMVQRPVTGVVVGISPDDEGPDSESVPAQLGANMESETYAIPVTVWSSAAGDGAAKSCRDTVFTIVDAIVQLVRTDRSLGGALHSDFAIVSGLNMRQTNTAAAAGNGRKCTVLLAIACGNRF